MTSTQSKVNDLLNYCLIGLALFIPWSHSGISIFIVLIVLLWIFEGNWRNKYIQLKNDKLTIAIVLFLMYYVAAFLWTEDLPKGLRNIKNYGHLLLIPVFLTSFNVEYKNKLKVAFIIGLMVPVVLSYLYYLEIIQSEKVNSSNPSVFMHHLDYSMLLAFSFIFLLNEFITANKKIKSNWTYILLAVIVISLLFIVRGRSGQVALIVALPLFILLLFPLKKRLVGALIAIISIALLLVLAYTFSPNFKNRLNQTVDNVSKIINQDYVSSWGKRVLAGKIALEVISENPVFGAGAGDHLIVFNKKMEEKYPGQTDFLHEFRLGHIHNQYLQILLELGIIGFALWLNIFVQFLRRQNINNENGRLDWVLVALFFVGFIGEPFMRNQIPSVLLAYFIAFLYFQSVASNTNKKVPDK